MGGGRSGQTARPDLSARVLDAIFATGAGGFSTWARHDATAIDGTGATGPTR